MPNTTTTTISEPSQCPMCSKPNHGHVNVTCKKCKAQIHYHCSGLSKAKSQSTGYICFNCKSPMGERTVPTIDTPINNAPLLIGILDDNPSMDVTNGQTNDISSAIRNMSNDLNKLKESQQTFVNSLSSFGNQLANIEKMSQVLDSHDDRITDLENLNATLRTQVAALDRKLDDIDQRNRGHNIQIDGIPQTNNENLKNIVIKRDQTISMKVPLSPDDIIKVTRVQSMYANKDKPIICTVTKSNLMANLIKASRKSRPNTNSAGIAGKSNEIFINEHLTVARKQLLYKAKQFKKANNYSFLWIKNGNIYLKKNKDTETINVNVSTDFLRLN